MIENYFSSVLPSDYWLSQGHAPQKQKYAKQLTAIEQSLLHDLCSSIDDFNLSLFMLHAEDWFAVQRMQAFLNGVAVPSRTKLALPSSLVDLLALRAVQPASAECQIEVFSK